MSQWFKRLNDFQQLKEKQMELSIEKPPLKCNTLGYADFYKATRWVEENKESLKGLTQDQISKLASAGAGMVVTISNIRAISTTLDIPLGHVIGNKVPNKAADDTRVLANAIVDLYARFHSGAPHDVVAIAAR